NDVGIKLRIRDHGVNLPPRYEHSEGHLQANYHNLLPPDPSYHQPQAAPPPNYALTGGSNHQQSHNHLGPSYHQLPATQPPPPPPYHIGFVPSSSTDNIPPSYINMPPRSGARPGPGVGQGFAMGLGAGAFAAGAAIFGDDFMSGNRYRFQTGSWDPPVPPNRFHPKPEPVPYPVPATNNPIRCNRFRFDLFKVKTLRALFLLSVSSHQRA
ncbi:hypothetical protein R6Q57_019527, partial [Mikania cordata]